MRVKDISGKKFHYSGGDGDSVVLTECTDDDRRVVVRLDKPKSGVPIPLGMEMCQVRPDDSGHLRVGGIFDDSSDSDGPAMVSSDAYRSGWDRTFGSN